jgi:hypothetical protein
MSGRGNVGVGRAERAFGAPRAFHALGALVTLVMLVTFGVAGCSEPAKNEGRTLVFAVEQFLKAPNEAKAERAASVLDVRCTDARVCDAKALCVASVESTQKGFLLKRDVEVGVGKLERHELDPSSDEAQSLRTKLDEAQAALERGHEALPACEERIVKLKRELGI